MIKARKRYQSHIIKGSSVSLSKKALDKKELKKDQIRLNDQIKPLIEYFEKRKIDKYQEFTKLLHDYKYSKYDQIKLIEEFLNYMKDKYDVEISFMKIREISKANAQERNILMNRIAHEYPNKLISFLIDNLKKIFEEKNNTKELINDFQEMINQLCIIDCTNDNLSSQLERKWSFKLFDLVFDDFEFDLEFDDETFEKKESDYLLSFLM